MTGRTRACTARTVSGRLNKANQFLAAAELVRQHARDEAEVADAFVTLCVHAGIAASDVICCKSLGHHSTSEDHAEAVSLLATVRAGGVQLAQDLNDLIGMKSKAGYGEEPVSGDQPVRAYRRAAKLVLAARSA